MIQLDVRLVDMVRASAFVGEVENGHKLVAYIRPWDQEVLGDVRVGDKVMVEVSPYDMSKGAIVPGDDEKDHESSNVS